MNCLVNIRSVQTSPDGQFSIGANTLGQGKKTGRYIGQQDVRCYRPPFGYSIATAELIDSHPLTAIIFLHFNWRQRKDDYTKKQLTTTPSVSFSRAVVVVFYVLIVFYVLWAFFVLLIMVLES